MSKSTYMTLFDVTQKIINSNALRFNLTTLFSNLIRKYNYLIFIDGYIETEPYFIIIKNQNQYYQILLPLVEQIFLQLIHLLRMLPLKSILIFHFPVNYYCF